MRPLILAFISLLVFGCTEAEETRRDLFRDHERKLAKAGVSEIKEYAWNMEWSPNGAEGEVLQSISRLNDSGQVMEKEHWWWNGQSGSDEPLLTEYYREVYQRNEQRQITEAKRFDSTGTLIATSEYHYTGDLLTSILHKDSNHNPENRYCYVYDERGNIIQDSTVSANGKVRYRSEMTYDNENRLITKIYYAPAYGDGPTGRFENSYPSKTQRILVQYGPQGRQAGKYISETDENGLDIETVFISPSGRKDRTVYEHNSFGLKTKQTDCRENASVFKSMRREYYRADGSLIE